MFQWFKGLFGRLFGAVEAQAPVAARAAARAALQGALEGYAGKAPASRATKAVQLVLKALESGETDVVPLVAAARDRVKVEVKDPVAREALLAALGALSK